MGCVACVATAQPSSDDKARCGDASLDPDPRIESCTSVIQSGTLQPDQLPLAFFYRGVAHLARGEPLAAQADLTEGLRLDPANAQAYSERGVVRVALNDFMGALADFGEAIRIDPSFAEAYRRRGLTFMALGDHASAMAQFAQSIQLDPGVADTYINRAA
ncbi:MAG TPA: tetratricopeptide repeat protein, partial [Terrimicrobiaceae bacterium]|nr:tetratricopeptide repeat protein [Terrimicrobiaceae bacterium]